MNTVMCDFIKLQLLLIQNEITARTVLAALPQPTRLFAPYPDLDNRAYHCGPRLEIRVQTPHYIQVNTVQRLALVSRSLTYTLVSNGWAEGPMCWDQGGPQLGIEGVAWRHN